MVSPGIPIKGGNAASFKLLSVKPANMNGGVIEAKVGIFENKPLVYVEGVWNRCVLKSVTSGLIAKPPDVKSGSALKSSSDIPQYVTGGHIEPLALYLHEKSRKDVDKLFIGVRTMLNTGQRHEVTTDTLSYAFGEICHRAV